MTNLVNWADLPKEGFKNFHEKYNEILNIMKILSSIQDYSEAKMLNSEQIKELKTSIEHFKNAIYKVGPILLRHFLI